MNQKKISASDFSSIRKMLNKKVLSYTENYANYCQHIVTYFNEPLIETEMCWLIYLIDRIEFFIKNAPLSETAAPFVGRFKRVLTKLKKIQNENNYKYGSRN